MSGYNELTKRLLAEGYTAENYPDYVKIGGGNFGHGDPLDNFYGGFEYTREYRDKMVFQTGCGLLVKGSSLSNGSMSYMGIDWTVENNCPVITCPLRPDSCEKRFSQILSGPYGGGLSKIFQCDLRQTDEEYTYEKSLQKARDEQERKKYQQLEEFTKRVKGHVCQWHMVYNDHERKWHQVYDPIVCARHCQNIGKECNLTGKEISKKRGNVFYDLKVTRIHHEEDLFHGQEEISITKGIRFLEHPTSISICEQIAKRSQGEIFDRAKNRYYAEIFLSGTRIEIQNVWVEQRESRDLLQDLADMNAGIKINYESDGKKHAKEAKSARRKVAQQKKIEKLRKKLLEVAFDNLEDHSIDKIHAVKWFTQQELNEIERERIKMIAEKENAPKQLSLFDLEETT